MSTIKLYRIYDKEQPNNGFRILVDRIWPRGISKEEAALDEWAKNMGPTTELRKWFDHEDSKFEDFTKKYKKELDDNPETADFINLVKSQLQKQDVILLYGAKNEEDNQAVVLQEYLENKIK